MRDARVDLLRCGMNYMIVLLHAYAAFQYCQRGTFEYGFWRFVCNYLCDMAMPTFFFVSGYLLFKGYTLASFPRKLLSRFKRLFIPYVCWNALFVVFYLGFASLVPRLESRVVRYSLDTWGGTLSKCFGLFELPIDSPLWFVRSLLYLVVLSPLIFWIVKWSYYKALLGLLVAWCVGESLLGLSESLAFVLPAYSILCFTLGAVFSLRDVDPFDCFGNRMWLVTGAVACSVLWLFPFPGASALMVLEAAALMSVAANLDCEKWLKIRPVAILRSMSFFAYASHFLFCSILLHVLAPRFAFLNHGKFTVLVVVFVGMGIPLIALVYFAGRRFCPRLLRVLDGNL